jgi:hypothetical protein
MTKRFDYVKYDATSVQLQDAFKLLCRHLEAAIDTLPDTRPKAIAMGKLEETYMWIGKAIRDYQITQGRGEQLQEERKDS